MYLAKEEITHKKHLQELKELEIKDRDLALKDTAYRIAEKAANKYNYDNSIEGVKRSSDNITLHIIGLAVMIIIMTIALKFFMKY